MPKKDTNELGGYVMSCDGCGIEIQGLGGPNEDGLSYCGRCAEIRANDPPITIHGRTLLYSELVAQAEAGDKDLAAALEGDTVQEQVKAARKR